MEAQFRTRNGSLFIKFEAPNMKDLFEQLARNQEVFDADTACGCCHKTNLRFRVREVTASAKGGKLFKYFELVCLDCHARLQYGQSNDQVSLFPKRRDEEGNYLPNNGWARYTPKSEEAA